jgi:hypothetical protein
MPSEFQLKGSLNQFLLSQWQSYVDDAAASDQRVITTQWSFGGDAMLLEACLDYARDQGVDVMVAAESDGNFY